GSRAARRADGGQRALDERLLPGPVPALAPGRRELRHARRGAQAGRHRRPGHEDLQDHEGLLVQRVRRQDVHRPGPDRHRPHGAARRRLALRRRHLDRRPAHRVRQRPDAAATVGGLPGDQPFEGRPGPVAVEAGEPRLLVRVRQPLDRREVVLEADRDLIREELTTGDAGTMPGAEQRTTDITAGPGGIMTDEVGVVTGDLTLRSELHGGSYVLTVQYKGAAEWYHVTGTKIKMTDGLDALHAQ